MDVKRMNKTEDDVYNFINRKGGGVSFAEIESEFGSGKCALVRDDMNITLWPCLTQETVDAVMLLYNEKRVVFVPATVLIYVVDGRVPDLPVVRRPPVNGYKELHWLPVSLYTTPQVRDGAAGISEEQIQAYREGGYDL